MKKASYGASLLRSHGMSLEFRTQRRLDGARRAGCDGRQAGTPGNAWAIADLGGQIAQVACITQVPHVDLDIGPIPAKEPAVMSKEALTNACVPI